MYRTQKNIHATKKSLKQRSFPLFRSTTQTVNPLIINDEYLNVGLPVLSKLEWF